VKLIITNETSQRVPRAHLNRVARKLRSFLGRRDVDLPSKEIVLVFLTAARARSLNLRFRGKDYATDVLSFASGDPECLGELVFCSSVLLRQAREHRHSYRDELTYMFIHGVLHLLGYDHEKNAGEAEKMFRLQDDFFSLVTRR
jgi:probable rRNA maturation factor